MAYWTCDECGNRKYQTLAEALEDANECINVAREYCDPEWPMSVEDISVYEAAAGCEYPDEEGTLIYKATEVDVRDAKEGDGCEYWCDYKILPVGESHD